MKFFNVIFAFFLSIFAIEQKVSIACDQIMFVCLSLTMVECPQTIRNGAFVSKGKYIISISYVKSALLQEWMTNDYQLRFEVSVMHLWGWRETCGAAVFVLNCHNIQRTPVLATSCQHCKCCDSNV